MSQRKGHKEHTRVPVSGILLGVFCVFCLDSAFLSAQFRRPKADITPLVAGSARAGGSARVAVKVVLPEGLHTQSNKPRDPNLIPTELTIDAPAGVTVDEIVWPKPTDFKVEGLDDLLAVFEHESIIGVQLAVASTVPNGELKIPAHFRYQACDSKACYAPTTADFEWSLAVSATPAADAANEAVFKTIPFATGERGSKGSQGSSGSRGSSGSQGSGGSQGSVELLNGFEVRATTGGYLGAGDFLTFI